jgi:hypothetical protein
LEPNREKEPVSNSHRSVNICGVVCWRIFYSDFDSEMFIV